MGVRCRAGEEGAAVRRISSRFADHGVVFRNPGRAVWVYYTFDAAVTAPTARGC